MRGLCPRWDAQDVTATRGSTSSKSPSPPRGRYVQGKIDQWWSLTSRLGVVFVMNCKTVEEAHDLLEKLPLGIAGMMTFELHPIGPLKPLMLLAGTPVPE